MQSQEDPALTIIVVNWNTREMTLDCIRSVYQQTHDTSFELIVVDNGSEDQSAEAIRREYPQVRLLDEKVNHGFAVANNIAAAIARGRRLLLLNSDTVVLDRAIDRIWTFAESCPDAGVWGGRTVWGDGSLNPTSAWVAQSTWSVACFAFGLTRLFPRSNFFNVEAMGAWGRDSVREVDIVTGCFLMIDTDLWRRLDGFDARYFMYGEEADLCLRAKDVGARPMVDSGSDDHPLWRRQRHHAGRSRGARVEGQDPARLPAERRAFSRNDPMALPDRRRNACGWVQRGEPIQRRRPEEGMAVARDAGPAWRMVQPRARLSCHPPAHGLRRSAATRLSILATGKTGAKKRARRSRLRGARA